MRDFDGRPFVAGSLVGLRSFNVRDGYLTGLSYPTRFEPGENVASCAIEDTDRFMRLLGLSQLGNDSPVMRLFIAQVRMNIELERSARRITLAFSAASAPKRGLFGKKPSPPPGESAHRVAGVGCRCGFYAYTSGAERQFGHVVDALVEGYGTCTVGGKGFRAEKARLVALIKSDRYPTLANAVDWDALRSRYLGVPVYESVDAALAEHSLTAVAS